jgi:hypothetical protein
MEEATNQDTTAAIEKHDGDDAECSDENIRSRYDAIHDELRLLSDWHRMTERAGGFEEDGNGGTVNKRGSGRTRTLKSKHLEDFSDDDFDAAFCEGQVQHKHNNLETMEAFRRRFQLFNKFARSVCHINAIARKEIFEAWAMALYVHETFLSTESWHQIGRKRRPIKRFADLACSHGLLSWAMLLLASSEEENECKQQLDQQQDQEPLSEPTQQQQLQQPQRLMTAVCIDIAMAKSSETAAGIFFKVYPQFCDDGSSSSESSSSPQRKGHLRWDYVEGPVENIVPHESTLLVGIHACGRLSDTVINLAICSNAPLALVPCCHSKKILTPEQAEGFAALMASAPASNKTSNAPIPSYSLADFTDLIRKQRLIDAGYDVREIWIPEEFTPKNRILLAVPPPCMLEKSAALATLPKAFKKPWGMPYFPIPLEDAPEARASVRSVAGRASSDKRKIDAIPPPAICVNVWLPKENAAVEEEIKRDHGSVDDDDDDDSAAARTKSSNTVNTGGFTVEALQKILDDQTINDGNGSGTTNAGGTTSPTVRVEDAERKPYYHPTNGRRRKTFRVHYLDCRNDKVKAKARHETLLEVTIPLHFPNVTIRWH